VAFTPPANVPVADPVLVNCPVIFKFVVVAFVDVLLSMVRS
jgi:hypothetical protein